ncbi:7915_t:CDS:2, partial [Gigaspora margarita]
VIVEDINVAINNGRVLVKLAKDFSLDKVREKLEINDIISNLINGDTIYLKEDSQPNWKKLVRKFKLDTGRNYDDDKNKVAEKKAFTIKDCELNILDDFNSYPMTTSSVNDLFKNRGLFLNPQLDLDFLIDPQNSRSYDSEQVSSFNIQNFVKAILSITKKDIIITEEFEVAVKEALNSQDINILKHAIEKFGQFVPTEIMFGGRLHYELTTYTGSTIQLEDTFIFGGDKIKMLKMSSDKEEDWRSSLQDFRLWNIIEFRNPVNIIEFLSNDLKNEIRELIGKTIIYSNIQYYEFKIHDYNDENTDPQVFATVSNIEDDDNDNIFTCMLCTPSDLSIPKLIINCTRYKSNQQKNCWIIVGYDFNSIFNPEHFYLQSTTRDCNHNDDASYEEVLNIRTEYSTILFGIPVVFEWNPSFKHSIIGHHFSIDKDLSLKMILESDKNLFISLHKEDCNQSDPGFIRRKNGRLFIKQPDGHISQDHFVVGVFNPGFKGQEPLIIKCKADIQEAQVIDNDDQIIIE